MTITYPPLPRDAQALCLALDAGDDAVLPILADALEDDPRADGLREAARCSARPYFCLGRWCWYAGLPGWPDDGLSFGYVPEPIFFRLPGAPDTGLDAACYFARSAAFLALAEALAAR